jgi:hypothetical protein
MELREQREAMKGWLHGLTGQNEDAAGKESVEPEEDEDERRQQKEEGDSENEGDLARRAAVQAPDHDADSLEDDEEVLDRGERGTVPGVWEKGVCPATGKDYWFNPETDTSTYEDPAQITAP